MADREAKAQNSATSLAHKFATAKGSDMKLYDYLPSGNSYKVRWVMSHLGKSYTHMDVDIHKGETHSEEFLALNPAGQIPLLVLDDGRPLAESNAIIRFLAEGSDLIPDNSYDYAKMLQWQFWEQYRHEPAIAVARYICNYDPKGRANELAQLLPKGEAALGVMDGHLKSRDWFVGEQCSLADVSLYAYTHVAGEGGFDLTKYPAVQDWLARFAEQTNHISITDHPNG